MGFSLADTEAREKELKAELERILEELRCLEVSRVILFGSLARDELRSRSDIDLVVVVDTNRRFVERAVWLAEIIQPKVAVDFLVYTPAEWEKLVSEGRGFINGIMREGEVLHEEEA
jgi:predicted nucleotidyltransferase